MTLSLIKDKKPTNHKQSCENCENKLQKGLYRLTLNTATYRETHAVVFCDFDCLVVYFKKIMRGV